MKATVQKPPQASLYKHPINPKLRSSKQNLALSKHALKARYINAIKMDRQHLSDVT